MAPGKKSNEKSDVRSRNAKSTKGSGKTVSHLDVGKSCIRFKAMDDLPLPVVKKMLGEAAKQGANQEGRGAASK